MIFAPRTNRSQLWLALLIASTTMLLLLAAMLWLQTRPVRMHDLHLAEGEKLRCVSYAPSAARPLTAARARWAALAANRPSPDLTRPFRPLAAPRKDCSRPGALLGTPLVPPRTAACAGTTPVYMVSSRSTTTCSGASATQPSSKVGEEGQAG
ncbi:MAG: hypothetical protein OSW71_15545, partial [Proteobacteria bacterium]|nr:hypothetical protein [Pseudomonadota bacterium]